MPGRVKYANRAAAEGNLFVVNSLMEREGWIGLRANSKESTSSARAVDWDAKELTVLNRVLRYTPEGFEYEADPRQAEKLLEGLKLDGNCNGVATPGLKPVMEQLTKE